MYLETFITKSISKSPCFIYNKPNQILGTKGHRPHALRKRRIEKLNAYLHSNNLTNSIITIKKVQIKWEFHGGKTPTFQWVHEEIKKGPWSRFSGTQCIIVSFLLTHSNLFSHINFIPLFIIYVEISWPITPPTS